VNTIFRSRLRLRVPLPVGIWLRSHLGEYPKGRPLIVPLTGGPSGQIVVSSAISRCLEIPSVQGPAYGRGRSGGSVRVFAMPSSTQCHHGVSGRKWTSPDGEECGERTYRRTDVNN
jgi:hypothetical protein